MTKARTLADMISDGVIGTTELADEAKARVEANRQGKVTAQVARKTADASGVPWAAE